VFLTAHSSSQFKVGTSREEGIHTTLVVVANQCDQAMDQPKISKFGEFLNIKT
jgi:hypothetical protein